MNHRAKFRADRSNRSRDMANGPLFKVASVRYVGFRKARLFKCPYPSDG